MTSLPKEPSKISLTTRVLHRTTEALLVPAAAAVPPLTGWLIGAALPQPTEFHAAPLPDRVSSTSPTTQAGRDAFEARIEAAVAQSNQVQDRYEQPGDPARIKSLALNRQMQVTLHRAAAVERSNPKQVAALEADAARDANRLRKRAENVQNAAHEHHRRHEVDPKLFGVLAGTILGGLTGIGAASAWSDVRARNVRQEELGATRD